jgi:hypothetical protein
MQFGYHGWRSSLVLSTFPVSTEAMPSPNLYFDSFVSFGLHPQPPCSLVPKLSGLRHQLILSTHICPFYSDVTLSQWCTLSHNNRLVLYISNINFIRVIGVSFIWRFWTNLGRRYGLFIILRKWRALYYTFAGVTPANTMCKLLLCIFFLIKCDKSLKIA